MGPWLPILALLAQAGGVSMEGVEASASNRTPVAFMHQGALSVDQWQEAIGSVSLDATDRVEASQATWGDKATLHAEVTASGNRWEIDLTQPGFPKSPSGEVSMLRSYVHFPIGGGVLLDANVGGYTGIGLLPGVQTHAAIAVWGVGTVTLNGRPVTDQALIQAEALSAGDHADDPTFRTLPEARPGDTEVMLFVTNLPTAVVPEGFLRVGFNSVRIEVGGESVSEVATATAQTPAATGGGTAGFPGMPSAAVPLSTTSTPPVTGTGGSGTAGEGEPIGAPTGGTFSGTGLLATPPVANNGSTATPTLGTPQPLNNEAALPLALTPTPGNAQAGTPLLPAEPLVGAPNPSSPTGGTTGTASVAPGLPTTAAPTSSSPVFTSPTGTATTANPAPVLPATPPTAPSTAGNGPSPNPGTPVLPGNPNTPTAPPPRGH